jgi:hypothetical protein
MTPWNTKDIDGDRHAGFDPHATGRILLSVAIITFCGAALASIIVILSGGFGDTEARILLSSFSIAAYSLAGLIATARFGRRPRLLAPVGLGSAAFGLALTLALIWTEAENDALWRVTLSVMIITGAIAHANLLLGNRERTDPAALVLKGTLAVSALLTALIVIPILAAGDPGGGYGKLVAVLGVLLVLGTLVVPIVRKMSDGGGEGTESAASTAAAMLRPVSRDGTLEVRYRGRVFLVEQESGDGAGLGVRAWVVDGPESHAMPLGEELAASDSYSAVGRAVQQIMRSVDTDRL